MPFCTVYVYTGFEGINPFHGLLSPVASFPVRMGLGTWLLSQAAVNSLEQSGGYRVKPCYIEWLPWRVHIYLGTIIK